MSANSTETPISHDRPGCVSAYAVLLWLGGGLLVLSVFSMFSDPSFGPTSAVGSGLIALILIAIGAGLWQMQAWGWWLVVIIQSLGVLAALLSLIGGGGFYGLVSGGISGGILYWFLSNRHLFLDALTYRTSTGPDGKPITERISTPKSNTSTAVIVGVVLAVFLVPICIIATLTLLGPQIGNVFSRIVDGLSATPMP